MRERVITAIVLLALLLPALIVSSAWPFAVFALVGLAIGAWEWGRLNGAPALAVPLGVLLALACAAALAAGWIDRPPAVVWWVATVLWVAAGASAVRGGPAAWPRIPQAVRIVVGLVALWTAWLALAHAKAVGLNFLLSLLALVWAADIAAYFGGRAFGKRKLALSISPGKSWEGVWSGMVGALVVAFVWLLVERSVGAIAPSVYGMLANRFGIVVMAVVVVLLVAMSVVGDLVESLVKRSAGAKDSSSLLPGHGGVLDRVDALLPVFPIGLALVSL
nr:phosphatidate cytidylyltransferase [Schlegelella koreensis]